MDDKQEARRTVSTRLTMMSDDDYRTRSRAIFMHTETLFCTLNPKEFVLLYTAQPRWREVPLVGLEATNPDTSFEYVSPRKDAPIPTKRYNCIFVPLYGFNDDGYRLGHGGGWYDRVLRAQPQALKIGVGFECGRVSFTNEPHDVPLDSIVTEKGVTIR